MAGRSPQQDPAPLVCPVPRKLRGRLRSGWGLLTISIVLHAGILYALPGPEHSKFDDMQAIRIHLSDPEPEPEVLPEPEPEPEPEPPKPEPLPEPKPDPKPQQLEPQPAVEQPVQPPQEAVETPELIAKAGNSPNALPSGDKPPSDPVAKPRPPVPQAMPVEPEPKPQPKPEPQLSADEVKALLADYAKNARSRIVNRQSVPEEARRLGHSGSVKLKFVLNASGQLDSLEIASSSGYSELDEQALSAVRSAAPFGHLPDGIGRDSLPMSITLKYKVD
ncbi:MAG: TonB family protein [Planctomycetales bacterium]|nr:TonB family protein [bacterium]UNM08371.1 MAG: TonB family protein [Planctomycetales bacterium]